MCGIRNSKLSSWIFEEYLFYFFNVVSQFSFVNASKFTPIPCILFSSRKFCFYLLVMWAGMWAIICLKETDSVQFFLFTFKCCQKLEELKLENQWTKISISQIKITFSENIVNFFKSENIRSGKLKLFWGIEAPFVK